MILKLSIWYNLYVGISRLDSKEEGLGRGLKLLTVCQSGNSPPMIKQDWWEKPDILSSINGNHGVKYVFDNRALLSLNILSGAIYI